MSHRAWFLAPSVVLRIGLAALAVGCAEGGDTPRRDAGSGPDAGAMDSGGRDAFVAPDSPAPDDGGRGDALTCEACTTNADCADGYCAPLGSGGSACLPGCVIDLPECPDRFECVANFTTSIPEPVCAPVGERCCVDGDGDLYGDGIGCLGIDCDESDPEINAGGLETCDGLDEDCDGTIDEGDPSLLCPAGSHVASTRCAGGACQIDTCDPDYDDCNAIASDGCEVDIDTPSDCGGCGDACTLEHVAVAGCDAGSCTIVTCEAGFGDCNGVASDGCEQPLTSNSHCGGCAMLCAAPNSTSSCSTGTCAIASCDRNWGDCDGRLDNGCESPLTTNVDCGACERICAPSSGTGDCSTGICRVTTCSPGFEDCNASTADGCETSIRSLSNCGACGVPCAFPNGTASCAAGACTLTDCVPGFGNCDGITSNGCETRVNTLTSCGACGLACAPAHASGDCSSGSCGISSCDAGWADCDGSVANGCETSLRTTTDCGSCRTACGRAGAIADCTSGSCRIGSCFAGFGDCDALDANGCETSLRSTVDCGGCGIACARANASATCLSGTCATASCNSGFANCDGIDTNGCETSLTTLTSCGGCGVACARANATAECSNGSCRIDFCNPGFANCDGVDANGCETSLTTLANCGACGTVCSLVNSGETCASGVCEITTCASGYGDCDAMDSTGCETSLRTLTDCGACGAPCARPGASATCAAGSCAISSCNPGQGDCDGSDSNGCEASLSTLTHCGACGVSCDLANASESCPGGTCTLGTCAAGYGNCDGTSANGCETALNTLTNCGGCGSSCALMNASESCASGSCEITMCTSGFEDCDAMDSNGCERSTRTLTDCGGCGVACSRAGATATCASGSCSIASCNAGRGNCDAVEANGCEATLTTLTNCGSCGATCDLPNATESCGTGSCTLGTCSAGFGNCDMASSNGCETALNTLTNCGMCGMICDLPGAGESCATGTCQLSGCSTGFGDCNMSSADGCETPLTTLMNCGGCGTPCDLSNATESCATGTCAITACDAGFGNCDGLAANGCEAPLNTLTNCGACMSPCSLANASESCSTGTCTLGSCNSGFGNCDMMASNGCERSLTTLTDCGACGIPCSLANATESCTSGSCQVMTCDTGFANCDSNPANGCEIDTRTSVMNCGMCGNVCTVANGTPSCSASSCRVGSCNLNSLDCNGLYSDGCEVNRSSDVNNCGGCGMACNLPHAVEMCVSGGCAIAACEAGWADCNGMPADGCERSTTTTSDCGACGVSCALPNASESCASGSCTLTTCDAGWGNCNMSSPDGCETSLTTTSNCGTCGTPCSRANATATCSSGSCAIGMCDAGFGSCDSMDANGCETDLTNTATACGNCSTNCVTAPHPNATGVTCSMSSCAITACSAGYLNNDGVFSNGCECMEDSHGDNCGAATDFGSIALGGTATRTGNLAASGDSDWYRVTFPATASCTWRPRITLSAGGEPIAIRVYTSCGGTTASGGQSCLEGGNSASATRTSWEYTNSAACGDNLSIDATPATGTYVQIPSTMWIEVVRTGSSAGCLSYTLAVAA